MNLILVLLLLGGSQVSVVLGSITTQPRSVIFCIGTIDEPNPAIFKVKSSYLLASYQWQYLSGRDWLDFTDLGGVTGSKTSVLSIAKPKGGWPASMKTSIRARVTEGKTILYSNIVLLDPQDGPAFTLQPVSQTKFIGETATFTSSASGDPSPSYQWSYKVLLNWMIIKGATSSSYTTGSARTYHVTASNTCGTVTSKSATLTLVGITGDPESVTICEGYKLPVDFTVTATGATAYQWQIWVPDPKIKGGGKYTDITGETSATLTIPVPKGGFTTADNAQFRCAVTFSIGTDYSNSALLTVNEPPTITSHPSNQTKSPGESATFTVTASSTTTKTYQWKKDASPIDGATESSYTIAAVEPGDAGFYSCEVSNSCGTVESNAADLTVVIAEWPDGWFTQADGVTSKNFADVYFASATEGWACALDNTNIYHTVDGGANWGAQSIGSYSRYLYGIFFSDSEHGWASGYSYLYYTVDGGSNWTEFYLWSHLGNKAMNTQDIHFVSNTKGWMVGDDGMVIMTADGGLNWTIQNDGTAVSHATDANLYGVHFVDANVGYACGAGGVIIKTVNGGTDWTPQTTPNNEYLYDIFFTDANHGWAVGGYDVDIYRATILKTTNGGATWTQITPPYSVNYLYGVYFTDANNGVAVGSYGIIIKTNDGGDTWYKQVSPTSESLNAVHFADADNGWAVGYAGTVVRTATGGCLTPSVNLYGDKALCANLTYTLVADTFPNNVNVTYLWSPGGEPSGMLVVDSTGTYGVEVTNLCGVSRSDEVNVTFYDLPEADAGEDISVCDGDTVQLNASGGLIYSWTSYSGYKPPKFPKTKSTLGSVYISDPNIPNPLVAGPIGTTVFTVEVTDINDCSSTDDVNLVTYQVPTAQISAPAAFCRNAEVGISYGGNANDTANYYWDFDSGMATPVKEGTAWNVLWDTTGIQTITLAVNEAGCYSDTAWFDVTVNPIPVASFVMPDAICDSGSVDIYFNGSASLEAVFDWDFDGGVAAGDSAGPYQVYWMDEGTKTISLSVNDMGCLSDTAEDEIIVSYPYEGQEICLIKVDEDTEKNLVVWERAMDPGIQAYWIYKEMPNTEYEKIGEVSQDDYSQFIDSASNPKNQAYRYKIAVYDTCGNVSGLSDFHQPIFLQVSHESDRNNLLWNVYLLESGALNFKTQYILGGTDSLNMVTIDSVSGNAYQYTDYSQIALDNRYFYRIMGVLYDECNPSGNLKAGTGPYNHSLSNLDNNKLKETSVKDLLSGVTGLRVFPNPFRDNIRIEYQLQQISDVKIEVYNLLGIRMIEVENDRQIPGTYGYDIRTEDLTDGSVYYLKFSTGNGSSVIKLVPAR